MTFEQLKEDLLKALKHATNIRHIDPNEHIILTVIGQNASTDTVIPGRGSAFSSGGRTGGDLRGASVWSYSKRSGRWQSPSNTHDQTETASTTVLTIQATKADVDAFAKGQIDFEQFQTKTRIFSY